MKQQSAVVAITLLLAMAPTIAQASASAAPRMPVRIRATVEKFDKHLVTVKTDKGDHLTLELTARTGFATVDPRKLADLKLNTYVGIAAIPGPIGSFTRLASLFFLKLCTAPAKVIFQGVRAAAAQASTPP